MFKGTPKFNREKGTSVDQLLEKIGGVYNATTWLDRTNYYANIGSEHLEKYIEVEADRMKNLWLKDEDRKPR
jgi:zinc protease